MPPNMREQRNKLHQRDMSQVDKAMRIQEGKKKTGVLGEIRMRDM